jgi:hemerythrin-like metal-binding protein
MTMPLLPWSEALELGLPVMDQTHREFVALMAEAETAGDAELPATWQRLIDHTAAHFGQEDDWMRSTGFSSANCHTVQHQVVLQVLREGAARAAAGDLAPIREMVGELARWFPQHAQTMDAALALHLRGVGYDAATGVVNMPHALPASEIRGCGSQGCHTAVEPALF